MTTTSDDTPSTKRGAAPDSAVILPFRARYTPRVAAILPTLRRLRDGIGRGDGAAMLEAVAQAERWRADFDATDWDVPDPHGDASAPLAGAWDLEDLVARAPARCLPGVLAKARLAEWAEHRSGSECEFMKPLTKTLAEGLARLAAAHPEAG
jgi:hypothetical protein